MPSRRQFFGQIGAAAAVRVSAAPAVPPAAIRAVTARLMPRVTIPYAGQQWRVIFTHEALLEIEDVSGVNVLAGEMNLARPSANVLRAALYVALRRAGAQCSLETAGHLLGTLQIEEIHGNLWTAWRAAMPEYEPENEAEKETTTWLKIWANNRQSLGLTDEEWLGMTPRMVQELSRARLDILRQQELMMSRLTAITANFSQCPPKQPIEQDAFMLHPYPKAKPEPQEITGEYLMEFFKSFKPEGKTVQ